MNWILPLIFIVFPLENLSEDPQLAWLDEGVAISISDELRGPGIETVAREDRERAVEQLDLPISTPLSRASMIRVAQKVEADYLVFGKYSGAEEEVRIELHVLDLKTLRPGGGIVANGPLTALPELENELSWIILNNTGIPPSETREEFRSRTRTVPNHAFSFFVESLSPAAGKKEPELLLEALNIHPDFPHALFRLGRIYFRGGDCVKAIQYLEPALKRPQTFVQSEFMLGNCYMRQDHFDGAVKAYSAMISRSRTREGLNNLGVAWLRKGDYPSAVQTLTEAWGLGSQDFTVGINLAIALHLLGDEPRALRVLGELVKAYPDQGMVQYLYGTVLKTQGEGEKAAAALEHAARLGTDAERMSREDPKRWARLFRY